MQERTGNKWKIYARFKTHWSGKCFSWEPPTTVYMSVIEKVMLFLSYMNNYWHRNLYHRSKWSWPSGSHPYFNIVTISLKSNIPPSNELLTKISFSINITDSSVKFIWFALLSHLEKKSNFMTELCSSL